MDLSSYLKDLPPMNEEEKIKYINEFYKLLHNEEEDEEKGL